MHLAPGEFIDLVDEDEKDKIDGPRAEAARRHLQGCGRCRQQLAELRAMMSAAADLETPEPSPLFWDHLSSRIREAVAAEGAPGALGRSWFSGGPRALSVWGGALAMLILAVVLSPLVSPTRRPAPSITSMASDAVSSDAPADDPALNLVAELAENMDYEAASQIAVMAHDGGADEAVNALSAGERQELGRLLSDALKHPGT